MKRMTDIRIDLRLRYNKSSTRFKQGDMVCPSGVSHNSQKEFYNCPGIITYVFPPDSDGGGYEVQWAGKNMDWVYFDHELIPYVQTNRNMKHILHPN